MDHLMFLIKRCEGESTDSVNNCQEYGTLTMGLMGASERVGYVNSTTRSEEMTYPSSFTLNGYPVICVIM